MKYNTKNIFVMIIAISMINLAAGNDPNPTLINGIDYQKTADKITWNWKDSKSQIFYYIGQMPPKYDLKIETLHGDRSKLILTLILDGRDLFSWRGHSASAFHILGDHLYYVDWSPLSSGGKVVAIDLSSGKEIWCKELLAIGHIPHFAYRNRVNFDINDDVVSILGDETRGRYIEYKDLRTGETVGHKKFAIEGGTSTQPTSSPTVR